MSRGVFITATATETGKTYVSAGLLKQLLEEGISAGYYKAAASDAILCEDAWMAEDLYTVLKVSKAKPADCCISYTYHSGVSPHLASLWEQRPIEKQVIAEDLQRMKATHDFLIVEGSGGIVCPLRMGKNRFMLSDVIRMSGFVAVIIADAGLGTINTCVLTARYAELLNIPVAGFLLNRFDTSNPMHQDNKNAIEQLSGYPILGCIAEGQAVCLHLPDFLRRLSECKMSV